VENTHRLAVGADVNAADATNTVVLLSKTAGVATHTASSAAHFATGAATASE